MLFVCIAIYSCLQKFVKIVKKKKKKKKTKNVKKNKKKKTTTKNIYFQCYCHFGTGFYNFDPP